MIIKKEFKKKAGDLLKIDDLFKKAKKYFEEKKYVKALMCCDKILKINPNDVLALNNKGVIFYKLGEYKKELEYYEKALKYFDDALKINPNNIEILYNKGTTLAKLKKYEEAFKCFQKALLFYLKKYFGLKEGKNILV